MAKKQQQSFNYSPEIPLIWSPSPTFEERNLEPEIPYAPLQSEYYDKLRNLTKRDFKEIPESAMSGDPYAYHNYYPLSEQKMKG